MSMAEEAPPPALPKKRAYKRRKKLPAVTAKPAAELAGLTVTDCCTKCNVGGCVISGKPYCAHPFKGGLHAQELNDLAAFRRLNEAKKMLGKKKVIVGADI